MLNLMFLLGVSQITLQITRSEKVYLVIELSRSFHLVKINLFNTDFLQNYFFGGTTLNISWKASWKMLASGYNDTNIRNC